MVATYEQNQHPYGGAQEYDRESFKTLLRDHASAQARVGVAHYLDDPALTAVLKGLVEESVRPLAETETRFAAGSVVFGGAAYNHRLEPWQPYATRHAGSVRAHLVCGVRTGVVAAVEVSATDINCSPFLPKLLQTTAEHFPRARELAAGRGISVEAELPGSLGVGRRPVHPVQAQRPALGPPRAAKVLGVGRGAPPLPARPRGVYGALPPLSLHHRGRGGYDRGQDRHLPPRKDGAGAVQRGTAQNPRPQYLRSCRGRGG